MPLDINARFTFSLDTPTDLLLQFEAAAIPEQDLLSSETRITPSIEISRVAAHDEIGERIWLRAQGEVAVDYAAQVAVQRHVHDLAALPAVPTHDLPGETVQYLFDSRYCQADRMQSFVASRFGELSGGEKIVAMREWIGNEIAYEPGSSNATTTAVDTFVERRGICRDFAHVMISLARAAAIPARYVSCFAPRVTPQDFHAVAEVFLADPKVEGGGAWYIVDATGMADPAQTAKIGVGRDAADVSFLTAFGMAQFGEHRVQVEQRD